MNEPRTRAGSGQVGRSADDPGVVADQAFERAMLQVVSAGPGVANRGGQVRLRLSEALGDDLSGALRGRVHRAVVAAEEHVPATLMSLAPLTAAAASRVAADLAAKRGWTHAAATTTIQDWATALGVEPLAPTESAAPLVPPLRRRSPALVAPSARVGPESTPAPSAHPGSEALPAPTSAPPPGLEGPGDAPDGPDGLGRELVWPAMTPRARALVGRTGLRADAAAHAYAGLSLRLFWVLIALLTVVAVGVGLAVPGSSSGRPNGLVAGGSALIALALSTQLKRGLLLASARGLTFVPFDRRMLAPSGPLVTAPWNEVRLDRSGSGGVGSVGRVTLRGRRVEVGREGSLVLRAAFGASR